MEVKTSKNKAVTLVLGIVLALAVAAGLYFGVNAILERNEEAGVPGTESPKTTAAQSETKAPSETAEAVSTGAKSAESSDPNATMDQDELDMQAARTKDVYTNDEIAPDSDALDQTIASCGDYTANSRDAQVYYAMQYYGFMNDYGAYATMFGLDFSKPLYEQPSTLENMTWEQYFLMAGLDDFHQYAALATKAAKEGYTMLEGEAQQLSEVRDGLKERYAEYGYDSADAYVQANFGDSVRYEDYVRYLELYFYAGSYRNKLYQDLALSDDQLNGYYDEHPEEFNGIDKDTVAINVRHILFTFDTQEGASEDEVNAAKEKAKAKAEALLEEWKTDPTEEHFKELAMANTEDPGSKENGGLYENVVPGQMVQTFNDWCFEKDRKTGDYGIVETEYGYHLMYFVSKADTLYWKTKAESALRYELMFDLMEEIQSDYPMTTDYNNAVLVTLPKQ